MTLDLIPVVVTVQVPLDEVYVGFFGKNEHTDRFAGSVG